MENLTRNKAMAVCLAILLLLIVGIVLVGTGPKPVPAPTAAASDDTARLEPLWVGVVTAGQGQAERGNQKVVLSPGSQIAEGDVLRTKQSSLQFEFNDQANGQLAPAASIAIEKYQYSQNDPGENHSWIRLIRGAFRTVSGLIGKKYPQNYQLNTPAALIGIRGTEYQVDWCETNCGDRPPGLITEVFSGRVSVTNDQGSLELGEGEIAYVANAQSKPESKDRNWLQKVVDFIKNAAQSFPDELPVSDQELKKQAAKVGQTLDKTKQFSSDLMGSVTGNTTQQSGNDEDKESPAGTNNQPSKEAEPALSPILTFEKK